MFLILWQTSLKHTEKEKFHIDLGDNVSHRDVTIPPQHSLGHFSFSNFKCLRRTNLSCRSGR